MSSHWFVDSMGLAHIKSIIHANKLTDQVNRCVVVSITHKASRRVLVISFFRGFMGLWGGSLEFALVMCSTGMF